MIPFMEWYRDGVNEHPVFSKESTEKSLQHHMDSAMRRKGAIHKYAFAIPTPNILEKIVKYSPIIELGAGRGYWAWVLQQMGAEVVAFDTSPPDNKQLKNGYFKGGKTWTKVEQGDHSVIKEYPGRSLFICWPPYDNSMAHLCLKAYRGNTVIYIGEGGGGCTANDAFHKNLDDHWDLIENECLAQWVGIHDSLYIYQRK